MNNRQSPIYFFSVLLISLLTTQAKAQDILTLHQAIQAGLEQNFAIKIVRNNEVIANNNNTLGNAGFLPSVTTNGSLAYTSNNTTQKFFSGEERSGRGAGNTNIRAGIALTWTAFDGFLMYAAKERLDLTEQRTKAVTRREMHELVTQIQQQYYNVVRIEQQIEIIEQSIFLNLALKNLAEAKLKIGTGTSLEVLQTANRLSADSSALLNLHDRSAQSKIVLSRLMNIPPAKNIQVNKELPPTVLPKLEELQRLATQQNFDLALLDYDGLIAQTQIKEAKSNLYPTVELNTGFNYNFSRAEVGFLLSNRTFGPTVGISANYAIFQGRSIKKEIANASIFMENVKLSQEDLEASIQSDIAFLYQNYQALLELQELEERNLETAQKNTQLSEELYRSGRATNFDVREAILAETQVKDRLSEVQFNQKQTEISLKNLAGIPLYNLGTDN